MHITIEGAKENNLKDISLEIEDGLTVVTGVSGSGKTSLVFDTVYHEARRRFQEVYAFGSSNQLLYPANVESIKGLGPAVAVGQNLLNRNPNSTLASASGLHPFLRILYARFGERSCSNCGKLLRTYTEDEIIEKIMAILPKNPKIYVQLLNNVKGSHKTLLNFLISEFGAGTILVDDELWNGKDLILQEKHNIKIQLGDVTEESDLQEIRAMIQSAWALGSNIIEVRAHSVQKYSRTNVCSNCGNWFREVDPSNFHQKCPHCNGCGCERCKYTGIHPEAASITFAGLNFIEILSLTVDELNQLFAEHVLHESSSRLYQEIKRRINALTKVGLGYIRLNRVSPSLSRGEAQRVRLAVSLTSELEDIMHILDEPTIGQHPADVARFTPVLREIKGPVLFVEHDRMAASEADHVIELGPGAGVNGGDIVFNGCPVKLWEANTSTGRFFSLRERVEPPEPRPQPVKFLEIHGANKHNLKDIDAFFPLERITAVTGVSGSGKTTLVNDVLHSSLKTGTSTGCIEIVGADPIVESILVDQSPIGRNPRSIPATYTKLSEIIRKTYSEKTGLSPSFYSFNRDEGACPRCKGMGAIEVKMRYLPSTWIKCRGCNGKRFKQEVLEKKLRFGDREISIAELYDLSVEEAHSILIDADIEEKNRQKAVRILKALLDIGLGYLILGQPSPTLSGGEAQRIKLAKFLGRKLNDRLIILDEPSTGLHPQDLKGLLKILDGLVRNGTTVIFVEHNTDLIRAADWVIDLGPGAGPLGGEIVYNGSLGGLDDATSKTKDALLNEENLRPIAKSAKKMRFSESINVKGGKVNNLKNIEVEIPKNKITIVTGVSGAGKSSLVDGILLAEAERRYLETLSLYERQGIQEGTDVLVDSVNGLGVTLTVTPERKLYERRSTVGVSTEINHHLAALMSSIGMRNCPKCSSKMIRNDQWTCPSCRMTMPTESPRMFDPTNYRAACLTCHGVGSLQTPRPEKLIIDDSKPLCGGAMYSPGFFPQGYLCQPGNGGYDIVQAFASRHGFDPATTPWHKVPENVRYMFYFGDPEPIEVAFRSKSGRTNTRTVNFNGFYGWIRDWDVGGTYTDNVDCPECKGAKLRQEYLKINLNGLNIHELQEKSLTELHEFMKSISLEDSHPSKYNLEIVLRRLRFLTQVGLKYVNLNRVSASLSAGEAQRTKLAGILGSGITSLTILLDEPSRGLHPSEVANLIDALKELRDNGNTVIIVEHDLQIIREADHIIDMGPGAGTLGGEIIAQGPPDKIAEASTPTGRWLAKDKRIIKKRRIRTPRDWMVVKGAKQHNLKGETIRIPLASLVGICGVSGSGKSTLITDTIGRTLAPTKHTTSVAREPLTPGIHEAIINPPENVIILDQTKTNIRSPITYLSLRQKLHKIYAETPDAQDKGLSEKALRKPCSVCNGKGETRINMGFLPDIYTKCETCKGTGYSPEAWTVKIKDVSLPELSSLTISQAYVLFKDEPNIARILEAAINVGLGYLTLHQPAHSLSGGEAQRLKIAKELSKKTGKNTLYILDEPSIGQHMEDVTRLVEILQEIVDKGHSVMLIEHHPHILANCDYLIELGPEGGSEGGYVVAKGNLDEFIKTDSPTSGYLKEIIGEK